MCRFIIGGLVGVIVMVVVCAVVGVMRQRQRQQQLGMELLQLTREQSEVLTRRPAHPVEPSASSSASPTLHAARAETSSRRTCGLGPALVWQLRAAVKGARAYENLVDEAEKKAAESEVKAEAEPEPQVPEPEEGAVPASAR